MSTFVSFERLLNSFFRFDHNGEYVVDHSLGEILMHHGVEFAAESEVFGREIFSRCSQSCNWNAQKKLELKKLIFLPVSEGEGLQDELRGFFERTRQRRRRFRAFNLPNQTIFEQLEALNNLSKRGEKFGLYTPIDISPREENMPCEHFAIIIPIPISIFVVSDLLICPIC